MYAFQGGDFAETMLSFINQERALVGVPPLTWNNTLATDAQTYADYLEVTGKNDHPSAEWVAAHPMAPDGENLLAGGGGDLSPTGLAQQAFNAWLSEKVRYFGQPLPCKMYPQLRRSVITHKWYGKALPKLVAPAVTGPNDPTYNVPTFRISCRFTPPGNIVRQRGVSGEPRSSRGRYPPIALQSLPQRNKSLPEY